MLMQSIGHAGCKTNIFAVLVTFVENAYLLPENILALMETTTTKNNEVVVKVSTI